MRKATSQRLRAFGLTAAIFTSLLVRGVFAQATGAKNASPDWSPVSIDAPNSQVPGSYFTDPNRAQFNVGMQQGHWSQVCRGLQINLGHGISNGVLSGSVADIQRSLQLLPDNRLALVDEQDLDVNLSHWFQLASYGGEAFGVVLSAELKGSSLVVRPTPTQDSCKEIGRLIKLTHLKSVVPITPERIMKMGVGELWRLPIVLQISHTEAFSTPPSFPLPGLNDSISLEFGQTGSALMTLYRLSENKVRFRLRINHARIKAASGQITLTIPAIQLFSDPAGALKGFLNHVAMQQLTRYTVANLSYLAQNNDGQQMLTEFILDPRDQRQMESLAKVMRGDIRELMVMAKRMLNPQLSGAKTISDYGNLDNDQKHGLDLDANYKSEEIYRNVERSLAFKLPFFLNLDGTKTSGSDKIIPLSGRKGEFTIYKKDKTSDVAYIDVPIKGEIFKHNLDKNAQAFVYKTQSGTVSEPQAIYIRQDGFLRRSASDVRQTARRINRLMELAGTKGEGLNPRLKVPDENLLRDGRNGASKNPDYHDGTISFAMIFSAKAITEIAHSSPAIILKSFVETLHGWPQKTMDWVIKNGHINRAGRLVFSDYQFHRRWGWPWGQEGAQDPATAVKRLCDLASAVISDLRGLSLAATPQARAAVFANLMAGQDKSKLAYGKILKIMIQLVNPMDLTADLVLDINKDVRGERNIKSQFVFNKKDVADPLLKAAGKARARFIIPSPYVD